MKKSTPWIIVGSVVLVGCVGTYLHINGKKKRKECSDNGGIWNPNTKRCDIGSEVEIVKAQNPLDSFVNTGKQETSDTIIVKTANGLGEVQKAMGKNAKRVHNTIVAMFDGGTKKIVFYEKKRYTIFPVTRVGERKSILQKGNYADGGRSLKPTEGINSGKTVQGENVWTNLLMAVSG